MAIHVVGVTNDDNLWHSIVPGQDDFGDVDGAGATATTGSGLLSETGVDDAATADAVRPLPAGQGPPTERGPERRHLEVVPPALAVRPDRQPVGPSPRRARVPGVGGIRGPGTWLRSSRL
jgi:hypothetical protein